MASEPYTAEAPSFKISMRSTAEVGSEFRSTDESAPVPPATNRRPFNNTSVRAEPRPRRLTRVEPLPPLLNWVLMALPCSGSACRKSPIDTLPEADTCSRLMTVTGAGVVRSLRRMREPVTTISSSALFFTPAVVPPTAPVAGLSAGTFGSVGEDAGAGWFVPVWGATIPHAINDGISAELKALYFDCMVNSSGVNQLRGEAACPASASPTRPPTSDPSARRHVAIAAKFSCRAQRRADAARSRTMRQDM